VKCQMSFYMNFEVGARSTDSMSQSTEVKSISTDAKPMDWAIESFGNSTSADGNTLADIKKFREKFAAEQKSKSSGDINADDAKGQESKSIQDLTAGTSLARAASVRAAQTSIPAEGKVPQSEKVKPRDLAQPNSGDVATRSSLDVSKARAAFLERQKSNSTSSIFVRSTLQVPDVDKILLSASLLLQQMISTADPNAKDPFSLIGEVPRTERVTVEVIYHFMKEAFVIAQWSPESNVIALVLISRLIGSTEVTFNSTNWNRILLCALLLAQKLWDDTPLANVDFPVVWKTAYPQGVNIDLNEVNYMEKLFLELLHYDVHVTRTTYTQAYFELYGLAEDGTNFNLKPLTPSQASKLEARTSLIQGQIMTAKEKWAAIGGDIGSQSVASVLKTGGRGSGRSIAVIN